MIKIGECIMNFTLLTEEQIFGDRQIEVFKKYDTQCAISDFAILLGGGVLDGFYTSEGKSLKNRTGWWWTKTPYDNTARVVDFDGDRYWVNVNLREGGVRPALPYSEISSIATNGVRGVNGLLEVSYGEYPQTIASENVSKELERLYQNKRLAKTNKKYTTDSVSYNEFETSFVPRIFEEYEYNNEKYIRFIGDYNSSGEVLSNNQEVETDKPYWIKVEDIRWLISEKEDIALAKTILFSGIQFHNENNYQGDFENTNLGEFLKNYFSKEVEKLTGLYTNIVERKKDKKTKLQKLNPDPSGEENRRKMTDTEMIQNWIESGQSVLLRGPSGIGKTERIKTLYPNLIYIKLTNNMFPEKVVGSINLQTGQSIPPDFAKQAIMACATLDEKKLIEDNIQNIYYLVDTIYERSKSSQDKIVILLDELLNVKPAIQSLVYTLVLNRLVEIGGGLKLPYNTVIVATGNQKKYSNVAEDLAEPLEKRFDHILDMEPKVYEWIYEYAIPNQVHPSVIGFILSEYFHNGKSEELADIGYFYEEPEVGEKNLDKYGCKGRTNDPRGWVSISNTLYAFERNLKNGKYIGKDVEDILRVSINSKLRTEWASDFFDFYNTSVISVEEVVTKSFGEDDLPQDSNERFACLMSLLHANEEEVVACRDFIRNYCDREYLELYEICWIGKNEVRMEQIMELKAMEKNDLLMENEGMEKGR